MSTKIPVLTNLAAKVDKLIIGGGMANTFFLAKGIEVGKSLAEPDFLPRPRSRSCTPPRSRAARSCCRMTSVVAAKFEAGAPSKVVTAIETPKDEMILDVGPKTIAHYTDVLSRCETLLWNGPLGAFEIAPFGEGTFALARAAAEATKAGKLVSVAGGGIPSRPSTPLA